MVMILMVVVHVAVLVWGERWCCWCWCFVAFAAAGGGRGGGAAAAAAGEGYVALPSTGGGGCDYDGYDAAATVFHVGDYRPSTEVVCRHPW